MAPRAGSPSARRGDALELGGFAFVGGMGLHLNVRLLKTFWLSWSIYAKKEIYFVPQVVRSLDRVDQAQVSDPITNRILVLLAPNDARVSYAPSRQLQEVIVCRTQYPSHFGCAFQMDPIIISQWASNDVNALHSQLRDDLG